MFPFIHTLLIIPRFPSPPPVLNCSLILLIYAPLVHLVIRTITSLFPFGVSLYPQPSCYSLFPFPTICP